MDKNILDQLEAFKSKDKFPIENWDGRGLIPSPDDVREKMNKEVNDFILFIQNQLKNNPTDLTNNIQTYIDDWDSFDFDTEETEYIVDVMCEVMRMVDVDCNDLLI